MTTLKDIQPDQSAVITEVGGEGALRQHLLDMGLIQNTLVTVTKYAPMQDPIELEVRGYQITLRLSEAEKISCVLSEKEYEENNIVNSGKVEHPGFGEGGRFHDPKNENPIPEGSMMTFALAGNQNAGKTTLFNALTGSSAHTGNFPGVTVDRKTGMIKGHSDTEVTDLPGIYSLSPYSEEEIISRRFILEEHPSCIINILDASNLERNMYLTLQLMELDRPMVLALNMMDEVRNSGGYIDINRMEKILGIPVVPISAAKNEGVDELCGHALHIARYQETGERIDFCSYGPVHNCLHGLMHLIQKKAEEAGIPVRFAAEKTVEGDERILDALHLDEKETQIVEDIIRRMEEETGLDRSAAIADMRYTFIEGLVKQCVKKPAVSKERERSEKIDRILTGRFTAIPVFILIMGLVFYLTFSLIGGSLQELLEVFFEGLGNSIDVILTDMGINTVLHSLIIDGILNGLSSVLSFLPIIITLFFFLSLLEDTGYMARIAFIMDSLLRKIGLSGRSIVPLLIGFGCTVPGVMASRTLPSERDRKMTILLVPFASCTAKLPIYSYLGSLFFPDHKAFVMAGLYVFGILAGIFTAVILRNTKFKGQAVPFVMELPNYRLPGMKNVLMLLWDKAKDFLERAFTIIFMASIVIWFLQSFDLHFNYITDPSSSILALLSGVLSPLFKPCGFGDWRVVTALFSGFLAKESVVSTLSVLFGSANALQSALSTASALSLLIFTLLYTPCVAAVTSVKRELGTNWMLGMIALQCGLAWVLSFVVYHVVCLIM